MASVVVDTDIVSYLFKRDSRADLYAPHLDGQVLVISFMTLAELHRWALKFEWGASRRRMLDEHLLRFVVAPYHEALCREWAMVMVDAEQRGRRIEHADAWQAATARHYRVPLVTHNRRHFAGIPGLALLSEAPA